MPLILEPCTLGNAHIALELRFEAFPCVLALAHTRVATHTDSVASIMQDEAESLFDRAQLKAEIAAAIRRAIQEEADELGISYEECKDLMLGPRQPDGPQQA